MKLINKAVCYRLTQDIPLFCQSGVLGQSSYEVHQALNDALHTKITHMPGPAELSRYGFADPFPRTNQNPDFSDPGLEDDLDGEPKAQLVRPINNGEFLVLCAEENYRNLPGIVVKNAMRERIDQIEFREQRKVYKKERDQIKDEEVAKLLPRAFIMQRRTYALVDVHAGLIWVQASSHRAAESLLSTLREALGSLPIRPLQTKLAPSATFTDWVKNQACGEDFSMGDSALFEDTHEDGGKVGFVHQDLTGECSQMAAAEGKIVTKVAIAYKDYMGMVVDDQMRFIRIGWGDYIDEKVEAEVGESDSAILIHQASYLLVGRALREMITALCEQLGGEEIPQGI